MKGERNIITMDGQGNISLPSDIGATAMTEWEICELFGVIAPTVRAGIKALCKSGVLSVYDIRRIIRISDRYSAEVYNLETIAALAFRIESSIVENILFHRGGNFVPPWQNKTFPIAERFNCGKVFP